MMETRKKLYSNRDWLWQYPLPKSFVSAFILLVEYFLCGVRSISWGTEGKDTIKSILDLGTKCKDCIWEATIEISLLVYTNDYRDNSGVSIGVEGILALFMETLVKDVFGKSDLDVIGVYQNYTSQLVSDLNPSISRLVC